MGLTRDTISNFIGGVSQQTDKLLYPNQSKELINNLLDPIEGLKKRPPRYHIAKVNNKLDIHPYIHTVIKEDEEYQIIFTGNDVKVYDLEGNLKDIYIEESAYQYISSETPLKDLFAVTIADYTFVLNKTIVTSLTSDLYSNPYGNSALIFVKQGDYGINYKININGNEVAAITSNLNDIDKIRTDYIASELHTKLTETISEDFDISLMGSTILITNKKGENFTIQTIDGNGDRNLLSFYKETSSLTELPVVAPNGFILKIIGDDINIADDYYVKFKTIDGSEFGTGTWIECPAPNIQYKIDPLTMPHALKRESDGGFTLTKIDWSERKAGDEDTAATPSFIGNTIQEVLTYKSRLGFISGDRICFSDVEDIFSFFKRSVLTELDTDPIDINSNSKMVLLKHSLPFNEGLMFFSETSQFTLQGGDLFSNSTVSLDLTTEYQCSKTCKPIVLGANGFFVFENGSYSRVMSLYVTTSYTNDAIDVTEQVPSYIPSKVFKITGSKANNIMLAISEKELDTIYVYNSYYSGENKVQSAWHKWVFNDTKILNIDFNKHLLYLTVQYDDGIYLEKIDLTPRLSEDSLNYLFYLDRKIYCTEIVYDEDNNKSKLILPYNVSDFKLFKVVDESGFSKSYDIDTETNTVIVKGKHTKLVLGFEFLTLWHLPKIYVRQNTSSGGIKVKEGVLMLKDINLTFSDSGYFKVNVNAKYTTQISSSYKYTGIICGKDTATIGKVPIESGTFLIPVIANNEEIEITIENDSYLPSCFLSMEWIGDFTYRGR